MEMDNNNPNFAKNISFSCEDTFCLNVIVKVDIATATGAVKNLNGS